LVREWGDQGWYSGVALFIKGKRKDWSGTSLGWVGNGGYQVNRRAERGGGKSCDKEDIRFRRGWKGFKTLVLESLVWDRRRVDPGASSYGVITSIERKGNVLIQL